MKQRAKNDAVDINCMKHGRYSTEILRAKVLVKGKII
jgi:hypothetical protein